MERQLGQARQALETGDRGRARETLGSILREDAQNVEAWILLSRAARTPRMADWCLSRALEIDPGHDEALHLLSTADEGVRAARPLRPPSDDQSPGRGRRQDRHTESRAGTAVMETGPHDEDRRVERHAQQLRELLARRRAERAVVDRLEEREAALTRRLEEGQASLQEVRTEAQLLTTRIETLRKEIERLEKARSDQEGIEDRLRSARRELVKKAVELETIQQQMEGARAELDGLGQIGAEQKRRLDELVSKNDWLTAKVAEKEEVHTHLRLALDRLEEELDGLRADRESLRQELAELRKERRNLAPGADGQLAQVVEEAVQSGLRGLPTILGKGETATSPLARAMMIILVVLGVLLLLVGTLLAYPHIMSRLWWLPGAVGAAPAGQVAVLETQAAGEDSAEAATIAVVTPPPDDAGERTPDSEDMGPTQEAESPVSEASPNEEPTAIPEAALDPDVDEHPVEDTAEDALPTATIPPAIPTRIVIPSLRVDAPVLPVGWSMGWLEGDEIGVWDVPNERAAGWHEDSALLGQVGNTVLNGHNTTHGEVFRDLYRLRENDVVRVYTDDKPYHYRVAHSTTFREVGQPMDVRRQHAELLGTSDDERLTLITCHPYGSTTHRLVITCFPDTEAVSPERYGD